MPSRSFIKIVVQLAYYAAWIVVMVPIALMPGMLIACGQPTLGFIIIVVVTLPLAIYLGIIAGRSLQNLAILHGALLVIAPILAAAMWLRASWCDAEAIRLGGPGIKQPGFQMALEAECCRWAAFWGIALMYAGAFGLWRRWLALQTTPETESPTPK